MPELIPSKSLPQTQFAVSLPLSLMSAMSLICVVPHFEGLDAWLSETRRLLDPEFLDEMALVLGFPGRFQRFTEEVYATLLAENPVLGYEAFREKLCASPEAAFVAMAHRAIAKGVKPPLPLEAVQALLRNSAALPEHLRLADLRVDLEATLDFLKDLKQLKARFLAVVERFWQQVYREEWAATLPVMEQSAAYHRRQRYRLDFPDLFMAVTGRLLPESQTDQSPEQACFVPSCYIGPYFASMRHAGGLTVFYNCRSRPIGRRPGQGPGLFPLLKALADETRLQIMEMLRGQEMYAQQIVDRLGISQAAVSRHLKLMVSAGVLQVRRQGGAKFYSVNASTLAYLVEALRELAPNP
jgi:DNA-binding transcriptional ArsR family regulator